MGFWEFLLRSSIKAGPFEVTGFGMLVLTIVLSFLAIRFGLKATEAFLKRLEKQETDN